MTGAAGCELYDRNSLGSDTLGIAFRFNITFDNPDIYFPFQGLDSVFQQSGFSRSRAADQVEGDCSYFIEMFTVGSGQGIVCGKQAGMDIHGFTTVAVALVVIVTVIMIMV
jgi:hypothetical protein